MNPSTLVVATTTVASAEQATQLAREIIARRTAACVQIDGPIISHYFWNGAVEESTEWRLTIKTIQSAEPALAELVHRLHPYELPQWWVAVPEQVSPAYSRWVEQSVGSGEKGREGGAAANSVE
jgi:periplasmic divalent cation tolerance protein